MQYYPTLLLASMVSGLAINTQSLITTYIHIGSTLPDARSALTTSYTVDQTTVIVIDPGETNSASADSSDTRGTETQTHSTTAAGNMGSSPIASMPSITNKPVAQSSPTIEATSSEHAVGTVSPFPTADIGHSPTTAGPSITNDSIPEPSPSTWATGPQGVGAPFSSTHPTQDVDGGPTTSKPGLSEPASQASGTGVDAGPIATTTDPGPVAGLAKPSIPTASVLPSVSAISSDIYSMIPLLQSWEKDPEALKDKTLGQLGNMGNTIDGFIKDLGGKGGGGGGSGCNSKKKRNILDGVADVFKTAVDAFSCIDDMLDTITDSVKGNKPGPVPDLIDALKSQVDTLTETDNPKDDDDDDDSTASTSETTCTSTTAEQVTIRCKPAYITTASSISITTTCSPSTTSTATGCSVTPSTTTITKPRTCRPRTQSASTTSRTSIVSSTMSTTESSTNATPTDHVTLSFPTVIPKQPGQNLCFRDPSQARRYKRIPEDLIGKVFDKVCGTSNDTLPVNSTGRVQTVPGEDEDKKLWVRWAEDQSGCQTKRPFPLGIGCAGAYLSIESQCGVDIWQDEDERDESYGGGFVSNSEWGCLEFGMLRDLKP